MSYSDGKWGSESQTIYGSNDFNVVWIIRENDGAFFCVKLSDQLFVVALDDQCYGLMIYVKIKAMF
jgi:hypothetical protein